MNSNINNSSLSDALITDDQSQLFESIKRIPCYFGPDDKRLFGWLHYAEDVQQQSVGMVICPALGVEYMNPYRSLRYMADYLALAGFPVLRFDYHGTGDSSGLNVEEARMQHWIWSINVAVKYLKQVTGCHSTGLLGLRMGASLAALASLEQRQECLILWAPLENGRRYIREIKALQMTSAVQSQDDYDFIEAGGAVFLPETANSISEFNLHKIVPNAKNILIIPRDDLKSDTRLIDAWKSAGLNCDEKNLSGYRDMVVDPHDSVVPFKTILEITGWVKKKLNSEKAQSLTPDLSGITRSVLIDHFDSCDPAQKFTKSKISESIVTYGDGRAHFAILTEPKNKKNPQLPTIIIANSGANHRTGPNRLYVLIARQLALLGFRTLRIDISGIGDSSMPSPAEENVVYQSHPANEIEQAIKSFGEQYNTENFILMGLCSGSYYSFHAAYDLGDLNISECILINPLTFYWEEGMVLSASPTINYSHWNAYMSAIKNVSSWVKLFKGRVNFKHLVKTVFVRLKTMIASYRKAREANSSDSSSVRPHHNLSYDLQKIVCQGTKITFVLSRSDPGYDILMTNAKRTVNRYLDSNNLQIYFIENADHTFSKFKARCDVIKTLQKHLLDSYIN